MRVTLFRTPLEALSRRGMLTLAITGALFLVFSVAEASAAGEDVSKAEALAKAAAWRLGDQLSLAGLLYAQGNQDDKVEELLSGIKPLAEAMQLEIKPFPPRSRTHPRPMPT